MPRELERPALCARRGVCLQNLRAHPELVSPAFVNGRQAAAVARGQKTSLDLKVRLKGDEGTISVDANFYFHGTDYD